MTGTILVKEKQLVFQDWLLFFYHISCRTEKEKSY